MVKIGVVGAGSWGTALAGYSAKIGHEVKIWALEPEVCDEINSKQTNEIFLPGATLPANLVATNDIAKAVSGADIILSVVPTQFLRNVIKEMKPHLKPGVIIASASKGIENKTLDTPLDIYNEVLGDDLDFHIAVFAGPSFAKEVIRDLPTTVVVAAKDEAVASRIQKELSSPVMRIYTSTDTIGVELCGSLKNIIAIASGVVSGIGFGDNTRAALITRGLAEIKRLVVHFGGSPATVIGMAGVGDMILTCTSTTSRNYSVGQRLGAGETMDEISKSSKMVAEGIKTTESVHFLAAREGIEMPITEVVYKVMYENLDPMQGVKSLMSRELKPEFKTEA